MLLVYVDDIIVISAYNKVITHKVNKMMKVFQMDDLGPVNEYLGVKVEDILRYQTNSTASDQSNL